MINWEDVRLFLAVAKAQGLAGAAVATGLSPPTLGRRILALERQMGVQLFDRHRLGYELTTAGQELIEKSQMLEQGALSIERWRSGMDPRPIVKLSAGNWTGQYIARHLGQILPVDRSIRLEMLTDTGFADLARREAHLGIRNKRPHQTGLACRKIGQVEFALYGSRAYVDTHPEALQDLRFESCDFVVFSAARSAVPSAFWLQQRMQRPALMTCSSAQVLLEAVLQGAGICILPCFIGESSRELVRVSDQLAELQSTRWLVMHDDDRHEKSIRYMVERIAKLFV